MLLNFAFFWPFLCGNCHDVVFMFPRRHHSEHGIEHLLVVTSQHVMLLIRVAKALAASCLRYQPWLIFAYAYQQKGHVPKLIQPVKVEDCATSLRFEQVLGTSNRPSHINFPAQSANKWQFVVHFVSDSSKVMTIAFSLSPGIPNLFSPFPPMGCPTTLQHWTSHTD